MWLGRGAGRLSLAPLGELAGGMDYAAVGQAVSRFSKRQLREPALLAANEPSESKIVKGRDMTPMVYNTVAPGNDVGASLDRGPAPGRDLEKPKCQAALLAKSK